MYKTTVFLVALIFLSIVTVAANHIWNNDFERSGNREISSDRIGLENVPVVGSLTETQVVDSNGLLEARQSNEGGVGNQRSPLYSDPSAHNYVEFENPLGPGINSNMPKLFDVDETQEQIAYFLHRPRTHPSGGNGSNGSGGNGSNGSGGNGSNGGGGNGPGDSLNEALPGTVADGGGPAIHDYDWVYPPIGDENPGYFPSAPDTENLVNSTNPVPEPATMLLLGAGLAGLAGYRLRRKKS